MFQFGSCTRVDTVSIIRGDAFRNILFMPVQFFFFSVSKITGNIGGVGGGGLITTIIQKWPLLCLYYEVNLLLVMGEFIICVQTMHRDYCKRN